MNINNASRIITAHIIGENLHITGENNQIGFCLGDDLSERFLGLRFRVFCNRHMVVGEAFSLDQIARGLMVGDNADNIEFELIFTYAVE